MSTRVYVGGISYRARENDLEYFFRKYGKLREISLKNGFAFLEFDDYRDADDACYDLNGKELMGERVNVEIAKGTPHGRDRERWGNGSGEGRGDRRRNRSPDRRYGGREGRGRPVWLEKYGPPTRTDNRLIVENLSTRVSWQDLKDYMRQVGDVTYADAHKTKKNEGCVEFAHYKDLQKAIDKLDGTELNGRRIKLIEEKSRGRSRSKSRSKSRDRDRSRSRNRTKSRSRSADRRSRSPGVRKASRSRSRSKNRSRSAERGRKASRSRSAERRSRSKEKRKRSSSRSKSRSPRRSMSGPKDNYENRNDIRVKEERRNDREDDGDN